MGVGNTATSRREVGWIGDGELIEMHKEKGDQERIVFKGVKVLGGSGAHTPSPAFPLLPAPPGPTFLYPRCLKSPLAIPPQQSTSH